MCRVMFSTRENNAKSLLNIHLNVWGPSKQLSLGGHGYFLSIIDDHNN